MNWKINSRFFYGDKAEDLEHRVGQWKKTSLLFPSLFSFQKYIQDAPLESCVDLFPSDSGKTARTADYSRVFEGHSAMDSWDQANKNIKYGWKNGVEKLLTYFAEYNNQLVGTTTHIYHDLVGRSLNMGRYVEEEPECWRRKRKARGNQPKFIRVVADIGQSSRMTPEYLFSRGAALAVLIDKLEAANIRCEVLVYISSLAGQNGSAYMFANTTGILVKRHQEPLNLPAMAYVLANTAFVRRLMWSVRDKIGLSAWAGGYHQMRPCIDPLLNATGDIVFSGSSRMGLEGIREEAEKFGVTLYKK